MPAAYDGMKFVFKKIVAGIKNGPVRLVSSKRISMPTCILKFATKKGHIVAPIPNNLSDAQFEKYMDLVKVAIQSLTENTISKGDLIAEFEPESQKVLIKTVLDYGRGKCEKQKTQKDNSN